jgi:peptidoglycan hydrolase CwlO-like protein
VILEAAIYGLQIQRIKLEEHIAEVRSLLGRRAPRRPAHSAASNSEQEAQPLRRQMRNAARKRIAAAQRKRWAAVKAERQSKEKSRQAAKKSNSGA